MTSTARTPPGTTRPRRSSIGERHGPIELREIAGRPERLAAITGFVDDLWATGEEDLRSMLRDFALPRFAEHPDLVRPLLGDELRAYLSYYIAEDMY